MRRPTRIAMFAILALVVGAVLYFALRDVPRLGDFARLSTGPMQVTIEEEGVARVRDVYRLFPPVAGHLDRVGLDEGDAVTAGGTVIASLRPLEPPFLDERTRIEADAAPHLCAGPERLREPGLGRHETCCPCRHGSGRVVDRPRGHYECAVDVIGKRAAAVSRHAEALSGPIDR